MTRNIRFQLVALINVITSTTKKKTKLVGNIGVAVYNKQRVPHYSHKEETATNKKHQPSIATLFFYMQILTIFFKF